MSMIHTEQSHHACNLSCYVLTQLIMDTYVMINMEFKEVKLS